MRLLILMILAGFCILSFATTTCYQESSSTTVCGQAGTARFPYEYNAQWASAGNKTATNDTNWGTFGFVTQSGTKTALMNIYYIIPPTNSTQITTGATWQVLGGNSSWNTTVNVSIPLDCFQYQGTYNDMILYLQASSHYETTLANRYTRWACAIGSGNYVTLYDQPASTRVNEEGIYWILDEPLNVTLIYPVNGSTIPYGDVNFNWSVSGSASNYSSWLGVDSQYKVSGYDTLNGTPTNYSVVGLTAGNHDWFIYTTNDTGNTTNYATSPVYTFSPAPVSLVSMVGNSTSWNWSSVSVGNAIRSGTKYNWSWHTYASGSGNQTVNGSATSWSWVNE
jgi:hypothetical protein